MTDRLIKLAYENPKLRRPILAALMSERRQAALGAATVKVFLAVLTSKITQWDKRYNKNNPYALGNYLGVVQDLEKKLRSVEMKDDEDSLTKLKQMMQRRFDPQFPPVKATVKQIDAYLAKGTMPSLVRRAARDLGYWDPEKDKGKFYKLTKGAWGDYDVYFYPTEKQKNGGVKGIRKDDDGRGKAKQTSIGKMDLKSFTEVPESDVPSKVKGRIKERTASTEKVAMSMGKEIFQSLVDMKKMYAARKAADPQTAQLLVDIMRNMMEALEPKNPRMQAAVNRLNNAIARPTTPDNLRNQIFKVANELGMKLPSSMF